MQNLSSVKQIFEKIYFFVKTHATTSYYYKEIGAREQIRKIVWHLLTNDFLRDTIQKTHKISWFSNAMEVTHEYTYEPEHCEYRMLLLLPIQTDGRLVVLCATT